jgi:type II secretory pathway component PulJ
LLEVLVASSIFAIVAIATYQVYETSNAVASRVDRRVDIQQNARAAIERLAREIRQAGYFTGTPPTTEAIRIATSDTLSIQMSTREPSDAADVNRYLTFGLRDANGSLTTNLFRQSALSTAPTFSGGDPIAENVTGLRFTYYTSEGQPIPDPTPNPPVYQLDGQGAVTGAAQPTVPAPTSDRNRIRHIRIELTVQRTGLVDQTYVMTTDVTLRNSQ